jgi:hypothetical protein
VTDENTPNENTIKAEFEALANNMRAALQAAWESEERQKAQSEIEKGLREVGVALEGLINDFQTSETTQRMREEVDEIGARIRSGEAAETARNGLLKTLQRINAELEKAIKPKDDM